MSEGDEARVETEVVDEGLASTGERFIPGLGGMIELEHRHRYLFARQLCTGKTTLDIACGEGYGSAMLAQTASSVVGVDIAADAIDHARKHYGSSRLAFKVGSCAAIPLDDASIDVVVSFETIEHHDQHEEMMREIRRVLRPDGILILSSPERFEYSERPGTHNEFHVRELYRVEFIELVRRYFEHVDIYDQKVIFGSAILSETHATKAISSHAAALHEHSRGLVRPLFLIAVASDRIVPPLDTGVFEQDLADSSEWKWWIRTVEERDDRIRSLDAQVTSLTARLAHQTAELERTAEAKAAQDGRVLILDSEIAELHKGIARTEGTDAALAALGVRLAEVESQRDHAERRRQEGLEQIIQLQDVVISLQDGLVQQRAALDRELEERTTEAQQRFAEHARALDQQFEIREQGLDQRFALRAAELQQAYAEEEKRLKMQSAIREQALDAELARCEAAFEVRLRSELDAAAGANALVRRELDTLNRHSAELQSVLSTTQHELDQSRAQIEGQRQRIHAQELALAALYRSTSWRVTAPLRFSKDGLRWVLALPRRACRGGLSILRRAYRWMPGDSAVKERAKDGFFHVFGFVLGGTATHEAWLHWKAAQRPQVIPHGAPTWAKQDPLLALAHHSPAGAPHPMVDTGPSKEHGASVGPARSTGNAELEPIPQLVEDVTVMAEPVTLLPTYSAAGAPLWVADGSREWLDLPTMRERIETFESERLKAIAPRPARVVSMAGQDLKAVAATLTFAAHAEPKITILIPVYNKIEMTLECLASIANARTDVSFEIVVADDASTDETPAVLALVENIKVQRNPANLHFLRNCNAALPIATGEYVVFLNNDVQVQDRWLDEMLLTFTKHRNVGAVGPKILYPSGHLQEAGVAFNVDMTVDMVGLNDDPELPRFNYARRVDYCSGACLMVPTTLLADLGGFSEAFAPAYCEDGDLCLRIRQRGLFVYYAPEATIVHRLSATTAADDLDAKRRLVANSLVTFADRWQDLVESEADVRAIAFYLPQYYPFPENDRWWGKGFTEWTNVTKAQPNFVGHYQPHLPADLGYYDLRVAQTMKDQAALARRYGLGGFCFYYYWFAGKRLLDLPVERLLETGEPSFPFCLCWANENWTRRWDGQETHVLMAQSHTDSDDEAVIKDLIRYFRSPNYIRIDGRPLLVVYRVTLFPDFAKTAAHWRRTCIAEGIGEIYIAMVESFELVAADTHPSRFGCDATVEFPPQGLAEAIPPSGPLINPDFVGTSVDYRTLALRYCSRPTPAYTRFRGAMPGWDNTPRRQNNSYCIEHATPGGFQAWLEHIIDDARKQHFGDERIVFINAWNEWAEGAHLEPDRRFGHTYLEALRNAKDRQSLLRMHRYVL